jgi:hypothetical protein
VKILKKHIQRNVSYIILGLITLIIIGLAFWYNESSKWLNIGFDTKLAEISPEFVSDNRSLELEDDLKEFQKLNDELVKIQKNNRLTNKSKDIHNKTNELIAKYKLKTGSVVDKNNKLKLYIDIFNFQQTAYNNIDYKKLNELHSKINTEVLEHNNDFDKTLLNNLSNIIDDYNKLNNFIEQITNYGQIKNKSIMIKTNVHDFSNLDFTKVGKFQYIQNLKRLFDTSDILENNKLLEEEANWKNIKKQLETFNKKEYTQVKDIKKAKNAQNFTIVYEQKDGYELDLDSEVIKVEYNGETLTNSTYVKNSKNIKVYISAKYKKIERLPEVERNNNNSESESNSRQNRSENRNNVDQSSNTQNSNTTVERRESDDDEI